MSDFLVELGENPTARRVVKTLGLPLPMPQKLARDLGPWLERPLQDRAVVVGALGALGPVLARTLAAAGANPWVVGDLAPFEEIGEAWARLPQPLDLDAVPDKLRPHALVLDATSFHHPDDLRGLYAFFAPRLRSLRVCGRVVVLGRPAGDVPAQAAAAQALDGFVRSAGRELGKYGTTVNLVTVAPGAEDRVEPTLRWLLSPRSTFVTGQPLHLTPAVPLPTIPTIRPLEGKVALVTGAARGIGAATARALAREGAVVIVLDRPADDAIAAQVAREVGGVVCLADVTDPEAPARIASFVKERFGGIDVVIHNAGITRDKTLANMKVEWWDQTIDVNLSSVLRITEALTPLLRDNARVTCLASIAGISGNMGQTNYAASKAGIIGYVRALAPTLAPRGIAVNAIAPGFIETRLTHAIPVATREVARRLSNLAQGGLPEDVAEVLTFLSTPGAAGFSGQILRVCGGSFVGA